MKGASRMNVGNWLDRIRADTVNLEGVELLALQGVLAAVAGACCDGSLPVLLRRLTPLLREQIEANLAMMRRVRKKGTKP